MFRPFGAIKKIMSKTFEKFIIAPLREDFVLIKIENLHKSFGNKKIFEGLFLNIYDGETITVIGRSGEGKSVLLKHIMGLMDPDDGRILIDDDDITGAHYNQKMKIRKKIGMLFQMAALFDSMTVKENVAFALREHTNYSDGEIDEIVRKKLELVNLIGAENLMPSEISGGMKKRVSLARALSMDPKIILYDEPTTGLDPITADIINNLIVNLQKKLNVTSVVVTHDLTSTFKVSNRIAMLYNRKIYFVGSVDEVKNSKDAVIRQFVNGEAEGPLTG